MRLQSITVNVLADSGSAESLEGIVTSRAVCETYTRTTQDDPTPECGVRGWTADGTRQFSVSWRQGDAYASFHADFGEEGSREFAAEILGEVLALGLPEHLIQVRPLDGLPPLTADCHPQAILERLCALSEPQLAGYHQ